MRSRLAWTSSGSQTGSARSTAFLHGGALSATRSTLRWGNPKTDEARLRRISPLFNADRIEVPLMVLQGANDARVLKVESDEIVAASKKKGVPVEYIVFEDEGHGFVKKQNETKGYGAVLSFLDRYLKGTPAAPN
jgi:dipeptidyl aminopeptidase/acylaminoacyl peptidase